MRENMSDPDFGQLSNFASLLFCARLEKLVSDPSYYM